MRSNNYQGKDRNPSLSLLALFIALTLAFASVANAHAAACKKWTYDHSETNKYSDTALGACKNYVKEKYPNDNYAASVEATSDPETYRCSGGDTFIGLVYQKECPTCCKKPSQSLQPQQHHKRFFQAAR